jgi:hypothetical protein
MNLKDLNTSNFFIDPKSYGFMNKLEEIDEFKFDPPKGVNKTYLCIYITIMCDPQSDIRKTYAHYGTRKREAALCSGFKLNSNGRFSQTLEDIFIGYNKNFNKAFIKYLSFTFNPEFVRLNIFQRLLYASLLKVDEGDQQAIKTADLLTEKLKIEEKQIFDGEESLNMRKALYQESFSKELGIKPEDIAFELAKGNNLNEFSKYGIKYEIEEMKFLGDEEPK